MNDVPKMNRTKITNLKCFYNSSFSSFFCRTRFDDSKLFWKRTRFTWHPKLEALTVRWSAPVKEPKRRSLGSQIQKRGSFVFGCRGSFLGLLYDWREDPRGDHDMILECHCTISPKWSTTGIPSLEKVQSQKLSIFTCGKCSCLSRQIGFVICPYFWASSELCNNLETLLVSHYQGCQ